MRIAPILIKTTAMVASIGACSMPPPVTLEQMTSQLVSSGALFDEDQTARIIGADASKKIGKTRIDGAEYREDDRNNEKDMDITVSRYCLGIDKFREIFGKSDEIYVLTDGAGIVYLWNKYPLLSPVKSQITVRLAYFGAEKTCVREVSIRQSKSNIK